MMTRWQAGRKWLRETLIVAIAVFAGLAVAHARPPAGESRAPEKLIVGTMRIAPFAMQGDDGAWSGLSIELWRRIAAELKYDYAFQAFDYDPDGLLLAVEQNRVSLAVAALPVSPEVEARLDFSHPYFSAGLGIAVRAQAPQGMIETLSGLLTMQLFFPIAALLGLLMTVGALVWLTERRHNPAHFSPDLVNGVADGIWWAAVTMTTTGYGDKTPVTWHGRAIALVWMFASIFFIAMFSATLASSFVVGRLKTGISGPGDLPGARIAVVPGSAGEQWVAANGFKARTYPFVIQASKALQRGDVEALVFERATLGHMIKEYGWKDLSILPQTLAVRDHALALPTASPLKEDINRALLRVTQRSDWRDLVQSYVGAADP